MRHRQMRRRRILQPLRQRREPEARPTHAAKLRSRPLAETGSRYEELRLLQHDARESVERGWRVTELDHDRGTLTATRRSQLQHLSVSAKREAARPAAPRTGPLRGATSRVSGRAERAERGTRPRALLCLDCVAPLSFSLHTTARRRRGRSVRSIARSDRPARPSLGHVAAQSGIVRGRGPRARGCEVCDGIHCMYEIMKDLNVKSYRVSAYVYVAICAYMVVWPNANICAHGHADVKPYMRQN